jgi:hypothetical protein
MLLLACLAAGVATVGAVVAIDLTPAGRVDDDAYGLAALLGPPLVGLLFATRPGWRALWAVLAGSSSSC